MKCITVLTRAHVTVFVWQSDLTQKCFSFSTKWFIYIYHKTYMYLQINYLQRKIRSSCWSFLAVRTCSCTFCFYTGIKRFTTHTWAFQVRGFCFSTNSNTRLDAMKTSNLFDILLWWNIFFCRVSIWCMVNLHRSPTNDLVCSAQANMHAWTRSFVVCPNIVFVWLEYLYRRGN